MSRTVRRLPLLLAVLLAGACSNARPWNVLLVTLDTTRADFIGCYGRSTARTPNLDRLAAEGVVFEHAISSNPVTQPAHATILTGVYPMVHGVRDNLLFHLPEEGQTLAELLAAQGYRTGAAVGGFPLTREFGTAQGFEFYDDHLDAGRLDFRGRPGRRQQRTWYDERPAAHVNDAILPWMREASERPFFVWLHYWDPHEPHIAPPPYGQLFADDPYQGEIAYADQSLGVILEELRSTGEYERTLVVVTADHGEGRLEHGEMTHAFLAYETTLHVPLIVRVPGRAGGRRVGEVVGTVDIVPTVLDLLGGPALPGAQGRSLGPLILDPDGPRGESRDYYAESLSPRLSHQLSELRALYSGPWKYIHGPRPELYNLREDPSERHDLSSRHPDERTRLEGALRSFLEHHARADAADATHEASDETRERLAALGYIDTTGEGPRAVTEELRSGGVPPQDHVGGINLASRLRQALGAGRFSLARKTARKLLEASPDNDFYRAKLAAACLGLGRVEEAAQVVDEARTVSAANVDDFLRVSAALYEGDDPSRGLALVRELVVAAETADGRVLQARMEREMGHTAAFEEAVERALSLEPGHPLARLERAQHLIERGSPGRAEEVLRQLLADYPNLPGGHLAYARLLAAGGRRELALERLDRLLVLEPSACEAHLERVRLLLSLDRAGPAREARRLMLAGCRSPELNTRATRILEDE